MRVVVCASDLFSLLLSRRDTHRDSARANRNAHDDPPPPPLLKAIDASATLRRNALRPGAIAADRLGRHDYVPSELPFYIKVVRATCDRATARPLSQSPSLE